MIEGASQSQIQLDKDSLTEQELPPLHIDLLGFRTDFVEGIFAESDFRQRAEPFLHDLLEHDRRGAQHSVRVAELGADLAGSFLRMPQHRVVALTRGLLLHDVGKLGVDKAILESKDPLTPDQRVEIRRHVAYGKDLLVSVGLGREAMIAYGHHKKGRDRYPSDAEFDLASLHDKELKQDIDLANLVDIIEAARFPRVYRGEPVPRARLLEELSPFFKEELIHAALDVHYRIFGADYPDL